MAETIIRIQNVTKVFTGKDNQVEALKGIDLEIQKGDIFGIIGMSGAGKSTLVRCLNFLEKPTSGTVFIEDRDLSRLSEKELRAVRTQIAMIFQHFNLLMQRNVLDNVCFPLEIIGMKRRDAVKRAMELLDIVGLSEKAKSYPSQLSGGQKQRVAIARALATNPKILLCDEATSALDPTTTHSILELIRSINEKLGITVILITHQMSVVESICRHAAILDDGEIVEQGEVAQVFSHPQSPAARRLVFPERDTDSILTGESEERLLHILFSGAMAAGTPLIARMAVEKGIEANIRYASTRSIGGKAYGSMLLGIQGDDGTMNTAISYLMRTPDVIAEEVTGHVL